MHDFNEHRRSGNSKSFFCGIIDNLIQNIFTTLFTTRSSFHILLVFARIYFILGLLSAPYDDPEMYAVPVLTLNVYEDVFVTLTAGIETGVGAGSVRQLIDYLHAGYVMR